MATMRAAPNLRLENYRQPNPGDGIVYRGNDGYFLIPRKGAVLTVISSDKGGWDHVSVSLKHRIPSWEEMDFIYRLFFRDDETVMELHVPHAIHINVHQYCLHLWRPNDGREIPRPPLMMV